MKKLLIGSLVAAGLGSVSLPASARSNVDVFVNFDAPPLQYAHMPAPRVGFVWVPGYWRSHHGRHYWVAGHYVRHLPAYEYRRARWVDHHGQWHYGARHGRSRDRDGDGVPNRYDRAPDNPYRY